MLLGLLAAPQSALGQASSDLISNLEKTHTLHYDEDDDFAQGFTTGDNSHGYKLTAADVIFRFPVDIGTPTGYAMEIRSASSAGLPDTLVGTLTRLADASGINTFVAPGAGFDLNANTTYFLVWDVSERGSATQELSFTDSDDEDTGGAMGWSIADSAHYRDYNSTGSFSLLANGGALRMAIRGYAKSATDTVAPVLSTAEVDGTSLALTYDEALDTASVGLRQALPSVAGVDLAARADLSMVRLKTGKGEDYIDGLKAEGWRGRAGLEASRRFALGEGASLAPFVEAAGRRHRDGADPRHRVGLGLSANW